jgi:hypothetical protein
MTSRSEAVPEAEAFTGPYLGFENASPHAVRTTAGKASGAIGSAAGEAAEFVGPVAGRTAETLTGYARSGLGLAGDAINAGRAKLSRDATPTVTPTPMPGAP